MSRSVYEFLAVLLAAIAGYLVSTHYNVGSLLTPVPMVSVIVAVVSGLLAWLLCWLGPRWSFIAFIAATILVFVSGLTGDRTIPWWAVLLQIVTLVAAALSALTASRPVSVRY